MLEVSIILTVKQCEVEAHFAPQHKNPHLQIILDKSDILKLFLL